MHVLYSQTILHHHHVGICILCHDPIFYNRRLLKHTDALARRKCGNLLIIIFSCNTSQIPNFPGSTWGPPRSFGPRWAHVGPVNLVIRVVTDQVHGHFLWKANTTDHIKRQVNVSSDKSLGSASTEPLSEPMVIEIAIATMRYLVFFN